MKNEEMLELTKRMYLKTTEILGMMKKGEFIVAHEKLGGVLKNLNALGIELEHRITEEANATEKAKNGNILH